MLDVKAACAVEEDASVLAADSVYGCSPAAHLWGLAEKQKLSDNSSVDVTEGIRVAVVEGVEVRVLLDQNSFYGTSSSMDCQSLPTESR